MASAPGSRSGGKILRTRRSAAARSRTPYDRPAPAEAPSPNWLSRFVLSPSRFIASGAGKIFSSVLDLDNASPSSSSSSSSAASSSPSSSANNSDAGNYCYHANFWNGYTPVLEILGFLSFLVLISLM